MKILAYQQKAVAELTDKTIRLLNLGGHRRKIVFEAPTGAGKTVMACQTLATLVDELKNRGDSRYEEQVPFTAYTIAMGGELTAEDSLLKDARTAVYTLDEVMVNDGTLTFGVKNIGFINATTVRWYGYRLTYLGGADEVVPPVGVEETVADEQDFTVYTSNGRIIVEGTEDYVVYTMSGLPVDKDASLPAGIYLVRAGSKTKAIAVD